MNLQKELEKLKLDAAIKERLLIVYVIESDLQDNNYPKDYKQALRDEIKNHKAAVKEYKEELKKLK